MYKILGADSREYGPVTAEQLIGWINESRANGATLVQAEGATEWKPLSTFPEFAEALRGKPSPPPITPTGAPPPGASSTATPVAPSPSQLLARDYRLDIGDCISRGWELYKQNFGLLFGVTAIFLLIQFAVSLLGAIPFVGVIFSIGNLFISGPLIVGVYTVFLRRFRGQNATVNDVFSGFSDRYWQYVLANIVTGLLTAAAAIPGLLFVVAGVAFSDHSEVLAGLLVVFGALLALVPAVFLSVSWAFTLPLVLDKKLDFWPAMEVSRKMTWKHFGLVLVLLIVAGLISAAGIVACGVGVFFTIPIAFAAITFAYLTIFGEQSAAAIPTGTAPGSTSFPTQQP